MWLSSTSAAAREAGAKATSGIEDALLNVAASASNSPRPHAYHRHVTVNTIVGRLQQSPVFSIPEAKQSIGVPPEPGF